MLPDFHVRYTLKEPTEEQIRQLRILYNHYAAFAQAMEDWLPDGRSKGIGLRKLEEALFWHRESILRKGHEQVKDTARIPEA